MRKLNVVSPALEMRPRPAARLFVATSILAVVAFALSAWAAYGGLSATPTIYSDPNAFASAIDDLGRSTVITFDDIDASPCTNTWVGRDPFNGNRYKTKGITFTSPNGIPLYIAPGCLFWNESNSLSVRHFPWDDSIDDGNDDDLTVRLRTPRHAVGFTLVDNDSNDPEEFVRFLDRRGNVIAQTGLPSNFSEFRAFVGIVSKQRPIAAINVSEKAFDEDDVNYDEFILVTRRDDS